jgi:hypothetical protein
MAQAQLPSASRGYVNRFRVEYPTNGLPDLLLPDVDKGVRSSMSWPL